MYAKYMCTDGPPKLSRHHGKGLIHSTPLQRGSEQSVSKAESPIQLGQSHQSMTDPLLEHNATVEALPEHVQLYPFKASALHCIHQHHLT